MNADEFVEKLAKIAPSIDYLISCGYETIADEIRNGYFLTKRCRTIIATYQDPLIDLICKYDTSKFKIGMLTLGMMKHDFPAPPDKIHVGAIEADILAINPNTSIVELLDHAQPDFVIAKCAASGGCFLDAILFLASFKLPYPNFRNLSQTQRIENNQAIADCALQCAKAAGITAQANIYEELLGYDPRLT
jgi:hypothetical protein